MERYIHLVLLASLLVSACDNKPKPKQEQTLMVSIPPPPPPPKPRPTPPPVEKPPEEQKVQEKQTIDPDPKPQMAKPEPPRPDEPPAGLGSNIKGDGNDGFGLSGSGNDGLVGGLGRGKNGGNPAGYYAGQVQGWITEALRSDKRTRAANLSTRVKLWIDDKGMITRMEPAGGESALASVLVGRRLPARPPEGKTMIVTYDIAARRP